MSQPFVCFVVLYFLVKLIIQSDCKPSRNSNKQSLIKYFVNDKEVGQNHLDYSRKVLKLYNYGVSDGDINRAFHDALNNVAIAREKETVKIDMAELKAAKEYLFDRWCYLISKN